MILYLIAIHFTVWVIWVSRIGYWIKEISGFESQPSVSSAANEQKKIDLNDMEQWI